jgi:hypothetical protein
LSRSLLELGADHLVQVNEEPTDFGEEIPLSKHLCGPLASLEVGTETRRCGRGKRVKEFQLDAGEIGGIAFEDGHPASTDLVVANPAVNCARPGRDPS